MVDELVRGFSLVPVVVGSSFGSSCVNIWSLQFSAVVSVLVGGGGERILKKKGSKKCSDSELLRRRLSSC